MLSIREHGCWELKGLECWRQFQGDRSAIRVHMRQAGIFNKMQFIASDYHLLFIPYEIMKNMARVSLLLETQNQLNN